MKLRDLDLGWLTVIAVGMFSHVNNTCIVGFCGDPALASFQADLPFILFILSVLTFVADHNWYPTTLKKPHTLILLFLNVITALTVSNLALKLIWLPLQSVLMSFSIWIYNWVYDNELHQGGSRPTSAHSAWRTYFSNMLEQHAAHAVPTPMLHLAADDTELNTALLQWTDDVMPYAVSVALSLFLLGSRFFACAFWDHLRQVCLSAQASLRRRRGRILLLPGGSLARLRSLAPRYVLSKVDDSDEEAEARSGESPADLPAFPAPSAAAACAAPLGLSVTPASVSAVAAAPLAPIVHVDMQQQRRPAHGHLHPLAHAPPPGFAAHPPQPQPLPPAPHAHGHAHAPVSVLPLTLAAPGAYAGPALSAVPTAAM